MADGIRALVGQLAAELRAHRIDQALAEAEWLLAGTLGLRRTELYLREAPLAPEDEARVLELLARRVGGEPLAYLLGSAEFLGHPLRIGPAVFIPRPETEVLAAEAIAWATRRTGSLTAFDVCAGSGALAISLAAAVSSCRVLALELSWEALCLAEENVRLNRLEERIGLIRSDLTGGVRGPADLIMSNPPYVPSSALDAMGPSAPKDPRLSLDGGPDGLTAARRLLDDAPRLLAPGGALCMECAEDQAAVLAGLARERAWVDTVRIVNDLAGRPRGVMIERRDSC